MQDHDAPQNGRTKPVTSETIEALLGRVSVRDYEDRPVGDATVDAVLAAAFRAPTSSNIQAYSVVIVRDPAVRAKLVPITGNQRWVGDAPVFLAFCAERPAPLALDPATSNTVGNSDNKASATIPVRWGDHT